MIEQLLQTISENVKNLISKYILEPVVTFMVNAEWWLEALIVLVVIVLLIFGIIGFIKACWKFLLIVGILGGAGFAVWYFFFKDKGTTPAETTEAITTSLEILKMFI